MSNIASTTSTGMLLNGNKGSDNITLAAAAYTGSVYGGNGNDTISAAAVDADAAEETRRRS